MLEDGMRTTRPTPAIDQLTERLARDGSRRDMLLQEQHKSWGQERFNRRH